MKKIFLIFAMFLLTFAVFADGKKKFAEVSAKHKEEAFKTLDQTFLDVKSLIADNADRENFLWQWQRFKVFTKTKSRLGLQEKITMNLPTAT